MLSFRSSTPNELGAVDRIHMQLSFLRYKSRSELPELANDHDPLRGLFGPNSSTIFTDGLFAPSGKMSLSRPCAGAGDPPPALLT